MRIMQKDNGEKGAKEVSVVAYAEIALKGERWKLEKMLAKQVKYVLDRYGISARVWRDQGRIIFEGHDGVEYVRRLPGVHHVSKAYMIEKVQPEELVKLVTSLVKPKGTFAVRVRRADKRYPLKSNEIASLVGEAYVNMGYKVDLKNPESEIRIEIRDKIYVIFETLEGPGGLPYGSEGRVLVKYEDPIRGIIVSSLLARRGAELVLCKGAEWVEERLASVLPNPLLVKRCKDLAKDAEEVGAIAIASDKLEGDYLCPIEPCIIKETLRKALIIAGITEEEVKGKICYL